MNQFNTTVLVLIDHFFQPTHPSETIVTKTHSVEYQGSGRALNSIPHLRQCASYEGPKQAVAVCEG